MTDIAPYVALAAFGLTLLFLIPLILSWRDVRRVRRAQLVVMGHEEERDVVALVSQLDDQVRNLREAVATLTAELESYNRQLNCALTNCAIVRYDAFRDLGGHQSASFALLDNYRSGIVVSAIAARDFSRFYVKHVHEGVADRELAPEEEQAVQAAVPRPLHRGAERQQRAQASAAAADSSAGARTPAAAARAFESLADAAAPGAAHPPASGAQGEAEPGADARSA